MALAANPIAVVYFHFFFLSVYFIFPPFFLFLFSSFALVQCIFLLENGCKRERDRQTDRQNSLHFYSPEEGVVLGYMDLSGMIQGNAFNIPIRFQHFPIIFLCQWLNLATYFGFLFICRGFGFSDDKLIPIHFPEHVFPNEFL